MPSIRAAGSMSTCARGPIRSKAAPPRSSATPWPNGCWDCPARAERAARSRLPPGSKQPRCLPASLLQQAAALVAAETSDHGFGLKIAVEQAGGAVRQLDPDPPQRTFQGGGNHRAALVHILANHGTGRAPVHAAQLGSVLKQAERDALYRVASALFQQHYPARRDAGPLPVAGNVKGWP